MTSVIPGAAQTHLFSCPLSSISPANKDTFTTQNK